MYTRVHNLLKLNLFIQISGARLGSIVQSIANLGTAFVIAFIYGWKLTLVIIAFLPFIMIAGALQMKLLQGVAGEGNWCDLVKSALLINSEILSLGSW